MASTRSVYVPDTGHTPLILALSKPTTRSPTSCRPAKPKTPAGAGRRARRAAHRAADAEQRVGNCINTLSLLRNCAVPCVILVTMRGEFADFNPWQVPMGRSPSRRSSSAASSPIGSSARRTWRRSSRRLRSRSTAAIRVAVLLSQRMLDRAKRSDRDDRPPSLRRGLWPIPATCWSSPGSAPRPTTSPPAAIIRGTSISGVQWAGRRRSASGSRSRSPAPPRRRDHRRRRRC